MWIAKVIEVVKKTTRKLGILKAFEKAARA